MHVGQEIPERMSVSYLIEHLWVMKITFTLTSSYVISVHVGSANQGRGFPHLSLPVCNCCVFLLFLSLSLFVSLVLPSGLWVQLWLEEWSATPLCTSDQGRCRCSLRPFLLSVVKWVVQSVKFLGYFNYVNDLNVLGEIVILRSDSETVLNGMNYRLANMQRFCQEFKKKRLQAALLCNIFIKLAQTSVVCTLGCPMLLE